MKYFELESSDHSNNGSVLCFSPISLASASVACRSRCYCAGFSVTALAQNPQLEEVVVTATKRAENLQDVPISVNALSGDAMRSQNIMTFDDYVEFLPNVVSAGIGPGQKEIYIRGSASSSRLLRLHQHRALLPVCTVLRRDARIVWCS